MRKAFFALLTLFFAAGIAGLYAWIGFGDVRAPSHGFAGLSDDRSQAFSVPPELTEQVEEAWPGDAPGDSAVPEIVPVIVNASEKAFRPVVRSKPVAATTSSQPQPGPRASQRVLAMALQGELAKAGRDKLTLLVSPQIASFGDWLEQLIAESTGKEGQGIVPIVGEPLGPPAVYGDEQS